MNGEREVGKFNCNDRSSSGGYSEGRKLGNGRTIKRADREIRYV
jgi:hypothetical protein